MKMRITESLIQETWRRETNLLFSFVYDYWNDDDGTRNLDLYLFVDLINLFFIWLEKLNEKKEWYDWITQLIIIDTRFTVDFTVWIRLKGVIDLILSAHFPLFSPFLDHETPSELL